MVSLFQQKQQYLNLIGVNRGRYRAFEIRVRQHIKENGTVDLEWEFKYKGGGTRPTGIVYKVIQNGELQFKHVFAN